MRRVRVEMDDQGYEFELEGAAQYGAPLRLLDTDDDLLAGQPFWERGFVVDRFLSEAAAVEAEGRAAALISSALGQQRGGPAPHFALSRYHEFVSDAEHRALLGRCGLRWPMAHLPVPQEALERWVSERCGVEVEARNPYLEQQVFQLRVVRPGFRDNNPPHRDVWLERLRDAVNIYLPLAGSTARSALPMVPGSHLWLESEIERTVDGAKIDGVSFTVQSVTGATRPWKMERPDPRPGEVVLFSPYLIHGGGANFGDQTRVSLELRFWRKGGPRRRGGPLERPMHSTSG